MVSNVLKDSDTFFKGQAVQLGFLECLTLEDEGNAVLQNLGNHSQTSSVTFLKT